MQSVAIGSFTIGRVPELEFPAFPALEFFPAATSASSSGRAVNCRGA